VAAISLSLTSCAGPDEPAATGIRWGSCAKVTDLSAPPVPPERLARLTFTCGTVSVVADPANPDAGRLTIQLIRATTSPRSAEHRPSLLLVPGGPGQSGVDNHAFLVGGMSDRLLDRFDVVGFDPRGVHHSGQIHCARDKSPLGLPDLVSDTGYAQAAAEIRTLTQECLRSLGARAPQFGTTSAAGDIDVIRQALGEEKLTYVGGSYGAKLGAEYARLFPSHIRAGVLDAPTDPQTPWVTTTEHQVEGFEDSLDEFVAWCRKQPCQGLRDVRGFIAALVAKADRSPIRSGRPSGDDPLVGTQVLDAVVSAMYDPVRWPDLAAGLLEADDGDSGTLWSLVEASGGGPEASDENDARFVINCTDSPPGPSEAEIRSAGARFRDRFPTLGVWGSWPLLGCSFWTARHTLTPPKAPTAPPLVVVGTVHDPATPYAGAVSMARVLGNGSSLLTWEGSGHTAFTRSPCVDALLDEYLLSLSLPADGTRCPA
jgi:pimeloyl-ACP methyl ester carboxylesterase